MFILLSIVIALIPLYVMAITGFYYKSVKMQEKMNWKPTWISLIVVLIVFFALSLDYKMEYGFSIFPSLDNMKFFLMIVGFIFILVVIVTPITYFVLKRYAPETGEKPKFSHVIIPGIVVPLALLYLMIFFFPLGEKMNFVSNYKKAVEILAVDKSDSDFAVVLTQSERKSDRKRKSYHKVRRGSYENILFVKNNLSEPKEVQVQMRAYDVDGRLMKDIYSDIMRVEPGEIKLVTTEESGKLSDPWTKKTFNSERRIERYEYRYKYWNVRD